MGWKLRIMTYQRLVQLQIIRKDCASAPGINDLADTKTDDRYRSERARGPRIHHNALRNCRVLDDNNSLPAAIGLKFDDCTGHSVSVDRDNRIDIGRCNQFNQTQTEGFPRYVKINRSSSGKMDRKRNIGADTIRYGNSLARQAMCFQGKIKPGRGITYEMAILSLMNPAKQQI